MAEGDTQVKERSLEETSTWAVAVVCLVLVVISIFIEHLLHLMGSWLKKKKKPALYEALEKIKAELMLMGFISLLLIVLGGTISNICVPVSIAATWRPCDKPSKYKNPEDAVLSRRRLLEFSDYNPRRSLAVYYDKCADKGQLAFVSGYGIHQLHVFIFVLAVFHVFYCIITLILGKTKMKKWKYWENETKSIEYQYYNDPERFRFARDTSFGRRHLNYWSESTVTLWIVCFFRQFLTSVTKVDYMTLRHGFIMAHLAPGSETRFDFQKYISRSLEEDFKVVVGITPTIWFIAVLFLLTNTNGSYAYLWLPFIPLVIILLIGAKLQVIITKLGLRIQDRGDVVKGAPVVQPGDDLFWFGRPRLILFLIHVVLFTNAFQLAFFIWAWYEYGLRSCFHRHIEDIVIRITMGVLIQVLCSYVTLPLYALVTQMGSTMKPTIFNDRVAAALKNWHHTAKKHTKHSQHSHSHSQATTPFSSRPATPTHGMSPTHGLSPVHLLHNYNHRRVESYQTSPTHPNFDNDNYDPESLQHESIESQHNRMDDIREQEIPMQEIGSTQLPPGPRAIRTQHEIRRSSSDFSFGKE